METKEEKKEPRKKISLKKTLRLYKYVKPYLFEFIIGMIFLFISSVANLAFPKLLGDLVDSGSKGHLMQDINRIGLLLVLILGGQAIFSFFRVILFVNVTEKTLASLRQNIYSHMIRLPMKFFVSRRVGELSSRISSDISLLQETFTMTIAEFIRQLIIIVGGIVLLVSTSVQLTLLMLTIIPVILLVAMAFGKAIRKYAKDIQTQVAESNTIVEETLQGVLNVKAFVNEFYEMKRYKNKTSEAARLGIKGGKYRAAFSSFLIMAIFGAMVAVIWRGAMLITAGELATGQLFSFIIYSGFIGGSASGLAEVYASIQRSIGATENLLEILDEPMEPLTEQIQLAPEDVLEGRISFRHVSFHYPSREDIKVLDDVSFNVSADQQVALVGPSGAGKSTIVSMLLRLYDPVHGSIYFDGRDGKSYPLSALRSQMAVVLQDVFLFGGTIRENIAYGKPGATEEEITHAAKQANALDFITNFPAGMETVVGERGIQLSGGQRQRIAIARAVLKNPRILILDEATSALDAESERLVQDALDKLMEGRTSIVIAHRLATVRKADKIIVMDRGQIVEEGTHKELITVDGGLYKNLSEMQFTN
ncbi:ATP-binding cassette domain-containing protein [Chitinophaga pendula]|uniref:ABC transporter ATP-binding protein n=1 Tax=Chitinophaga TaxID=79328 RepID=UPI000BAE896D|nr:MULTISPECIES: ABC transporter transmembrane domain-containing protein [Chitinophaga]ASZ12932.1 multidrug ABC transporter ATP-binding protein [Chitinophaga sp. MD30]UCJ09440.1 ATP-binding cassette domain-containing protein [Chitinophaga pendula]